MKNIWRVQTEDGRIIVRRLEPRAGFYSGWWSGLEASCDLFSIPEKYPVGSIGRAWSRVGEYICEAIDTLEKEIRKDTPAIKTGAGARTESKTGEYAS